MVVMMRFLKGLMLCYLLELLWRTLHISAAGYGKKEYFAFLSLDNAQFLLGALSQSLRSLTVYRGTVETLESV